MKKLLFLGACLVALASQPVKAQTTRPNVVVVQVYYTGMSGIQHIAITRGEGQTEDIEIKGTFPNGSDHKAAEAYQRVVEKLFSEGYTLKSTFSLGTSPNVTLLFEQRR
jgi:hypothetical protein